MEPTNSAKILSAKMLPADSDDLAQHTLRYFRPSYKGFWHWAEEGYLVEWYNGETLCYREELTDLLRGQEGLGLPRLGTVLLVLAACQDSWAESDRIQQLDQQFVIGERGYENRLESRLYAAKRFLDLVAQLPAELRKGRKRIHLLRCFIGFLQNLEVSADQLPHLLDYFQGGQLNGQILGDAEGNGRNALELDLWPFRQVYMRFENVDQLERHLRTGLSELPAPAPLDLPDDAPPADLLEQLARDRDTAGLARLAQRLVAALHIPLHARGASELPLGGISDITNRGDFDRLLLSELAQDDLTLTARLVNNEALFLRREEPPQHLERQRTVLMDTTLKMWGLSRVFALSAALACARQEKQAVAAVQAFTLSGEGFEPMDLHTKEGVADALTRLDVALHCGNGLRAFFAETPPHDTHDYILVSDADAMRDPDFQAVFSDIRSRLRFLVVLHRDGRLEFFEYTNGHRKLLFSPKFDLNTLLFPKGKTPQPAPQRLDSGLILPAFFQQNPPPLRFPTRGLKTLKKRSFEHPEFGLVLVTPQQRVLYWDDYDKAPQELLTYIEPGETYQIEFGNLGDIYILVVDQGGQFAKFYLIISSKAYAYHNLAAADRVLSIDIVKKASMIRAASIDSHRDILFVDSFRRGVYGIDFQTWEEVSVQGQYPDVDSHKIREAQWEQLNRKMDVAAIRAKLKVKYRSIITAKYIGLDLKSSCLMLDNHALDIDNDGNLVWSDSPAIFPEQSAQPTRHPHPDNPKISLLTHTWADGSQAVLDTRGLLHLYSSDPEVPDVTILAIINHPVAAWAADGTVGGHPHFLPSSGGDKICSGREFYRLYIQPFIDGLTANASKM